MFAFAKIYSFIQTSSDAALLSVCKLFLWKIFYEVLIRRRIAPDEKYFPEKEDFFCIDETSPSVLLTLMWNHKYPNGCDFYIFSRVCPWIILIEGGRLVYNENRDRVPFPAHHILAIKRYGVWIYPHSQYICQWARIYWIHLGNKKWLCVNWWFMVGGFGYCGTRWSCINIKRDNKKVVLWLRKNRLSKSLCLSIWSFFRRSMASCNGLC